MTKTLDASHCRNIIVTTLHDILKAFCILMLNDKNFVLLFILIILYQINIVN